MAAPNLTHSAVHEYDQLGSEAFLERYGYRENRWYLLKHGDREYDAAVIVGAALRNHSADGVFAPVAEPVDDRWAAELLRELQLPVREVRGPAWIREEIILACALLEANGWRTLSTDDEQVIALSRTLQKLGAHPPESRGPKYRNFNGVKRKTADLATRHPAYKGKRTNGNRLDSEVLQDFLDRPDEMHEMHEIARSIIAGVENGEFERLPELFEEEDEGVGEGRLLVRRHLARERNSAVAEQKDQLGASAAELS